MPYETHTFTVNRSVNRVRQNAMKTDAWIPLLFSMGYDGKRVKVKKQEEKELGQGQVGAVYKAEFYEITTSFAKDKRELFEITETSDSSITIRYQPNQNRQGQGLAPSEDERLPNIVLKWSEIDKRNTQVQLNQLALPPAPDWGLASVLLCCCFVNEYRRAKRVIQYRADCHEELELYLAC